MRKLKLLHGFVAYFAIRSDPASNAPLRASGALLNRQAPRCAVALVFASALSYFCAVYLYPGGRSFAHASLGYSHLNNYLCDLFEQPPNDNSHNPARLLGIASLVTLSLSLVPLFIGLPSLMRVSSKQARSIPYVGSLGALCACLIFTPLHDRAVVFAFGLTLVAFLLSLFELFRAGFARLVLLGLWPLIAGSTAFALWILQALAAITPLTQKIAILGMMLWIFAVTLVTRNLSLATNNSHKHGPLVRPSNS